MVTARRRGKAIYSLTELHRYERVIWRGNIRSISIIFKTKIHILYREFNIIILFYFILYSTAFWFENDATAMSGLINILNGGGKSQALVDDRDGMSKEKTFCCNNYFEINILKNYRIRFYHVRPSLPP